MTAATEKKVFIPLVNTSDEIIGSGEKMDVHVKGLLHRAFSIVVYNDNEEMLIHRRALGKYHSPGLWTNTCCSHPNVGESMGDAVNRRLVEEMGFSCDLTYQFKFLYKASFTNGLTEHELDHVYLGNYSGSIEINEEEVDSYKWVKKTEVQADMKKHPENYTYWFRYLLENYGSQI